MSSSRDQAYQLEDKYQLYWGIFEAAGDGLIVQDSETQRVVEANPAAAAMHRHMVSTSGSSGMRIGYS